MENVNYFGNFVADMIDEDNDGISVRLVFTPEDEGIKKILGEDGKYFWFDVWENDGYINGDWNQYIFDNYSTRDKTREAIQYANDDECGAYNYDCAYSEVMCYLETLGKIKEDENGEEHLIYAE